MINLLNINILADYFVKGHKKQKNNPDENQIINKIVRIIGFVDSTPEFKNQLMIIIRNYKKKEHRRNNKHTVISSNTLFFTHFSEAVCYKI